MNIDDIHILRTIVREEVNMIVEPLREEVRDSKNQLMERTDKVITELNTIRQEQAAHQLQHDSLEQELKEVKTLPIIAHELKKSKH